MHCRIWQITDKRLEEEQYINEASFYEGNYDFFDYVSDQSEEQVKDDIGNWLPHLLRGLFTCNGRELTFIGSEDFLNDWCGSIRKLAERMTPSTLIDWKDFYDFKRVVLYTHRDLFHHFYTDANYLSYPHNFGEFVRELYGSYEPGDKFYVGGVVDFHY